MAGNSKFATAIHVAGMISMAEQMPMTSEIIAQSIGTNAVVVRRIIGLLVAGNIVKVKMGTGGGAYLARKPEEITLAEIFLALEQGAIFDVKKNEENNFCAIGNVVRPILFELLQEAEQDLIEKLRKTTLANVIERVKMQMSEKSVCEINLNV